MVIENICKIMQEKGISAYRMEKDIGIKQATFGTWKKGTQPTADKLKKIIEYLGVSADEVFFGEKDGLSPEELDLIKNFRLLEDEEQEMIRKKIEKLLPDQDEYVPEQEEKLLS